MVLESSKHFRKLSEERKEDKSTHSVFFVDPSKEYDRWQQAYRLIGPFIDCGDDNTEGHVCKRYMIWAAYVDPLYQGGGMDEYEDRSHLDCHKSNTHWELLGVYKQPLLAFIKNLADHKWNQSEYEYVTTHSALDYISEDDCFAAGNDIYAGIKPMPGGSIQMGLYLDQDCLEPQDIKGKTYDKIVGLSSDKDQNISDYFTFHYWNATLRKNDNPDDWWENAQEYKLKKLNKILGRFKHCTLCMNYPSYEYGTETGYLINQCQNFYSDESTHCQGNCILQASNQGTINTIRYQSTDRYIEYGRNDDLFGSSWANLFLLLSIICFIVVALVFYGSFTINSSKRDDEEMDYYDMKRRADYIFNQRTKSLNKIRGSNISTSSRRSRSPGSSRRSRFSRSRSSRSRSRSRSGGRGRSSSKKRLNSSHKAILHILNIEGRQSSYEPPRIVPSQATIEMREKPPVSNMNVTNIYSVKEKCLAKKYKEKVDKNDQRLTYKKHPQVQNITNEKREKIDLCSFK